MFIKLTNIRDEAEYVNISKVETIGISSVGSIICFGGENNYILVKETPEEIIEKIKSA